MSISGTRFSILSRSCLKFSKDFIGLSMDSVQFNWLEFRSKSKKSDNNKGNRWQRPGNTKTIREITVTKKTEFRFTDFYPAFIGSSPCSIEEHYTTCTSLHIFASSNTNKK